MGNGSTASDMALHRRGRDIHALLCDTIITG